MLRYRSVSLPVFRYRSVSLPVFRETIVMKSITLSSRRSIPSVGFGLWKIDQADAADVVVQAIDTGYRHFDAASDYGNEAEVGQGFARAFESGVVSREDLWITSKLWNTYHRPENVLPALKRTLFDLRVDFLDLYLIHFPISLAFVPFEQRYPAGWFFDPESDSPAMKPDRVPIIETWQAMEELVDAGLMREIGVCNFGVSLLRDLIASTSTPPAVLQIESHPYLTQEKLLRFCRESGIAVTAFSPLGAQSYFELSMADQDESVIEQSCVKQIAQRHARTPAQVILRWGIQRGVSIVPKTTRPERMIENLSLFDFELSDTEMNEISSLNRDRRFNDPGDFGETAFNTFFPIYE